MRALLSCAIVGFVASLAVAQVPLSGTTTKYRNTLELLDTRVPEIAFTDAPLESVIQSVVETTMQISVVVRWQTLENEGVPRDKAISLHVKNVRFSQALWMILNEAGGSDLKLAYRVSGNRDDGYLLIISTAQDLGQEMIVKVYPVGDLLVRIQNFSGPRIDLSQTTQQGGQGGGQSLFQDDDRDEDRDRDQNRDAAATPEMERLMTLIRLTVDPDSWDTANGLGTIHAWRDQIVVRNNIYVHQKLGGPIELE